MREWKQALIALDEHPGYHRGTAFDRIQTQIRRKRLGRSHERWTDSVHWQKVANVPEHFGLEPGVHVFIADVIHNRTGQSIITPMLLPMGYCERMERDAYSLPSILGE